MKTATCWRRFFSTRTGSARVTESLNSGVVERLPWCELVRRVEGLSGHVDLEIRLEPIRAAGPARRVNHPNADIRYIGDLATTFRHDPELEITVDEDARTIARWTARAGQRTCLGLLVSDRAPLAIPALSDIDDRIDSSDRDWRRWAGQLTYDGPLADDLRRCALSLKFLVFSKTGAIAAAATSGLPERIGGDKNYDYRYAWVRDAAYTIKALLRAGSLEEPIAAFGWLVRTLGPRPLVVYTLNGAEVPDERIIDVPGYKGSRPVMTGNRAKEQVQLSCYGDILETASLFARMGHVIDPGAARLLTKLADQCMEQWKVKDSGIWELEDEQHYTFSKIGCWLALSKAAQLAQAGHIAGDADKWKRESERVKAWVDENCWSERLQAYTRHAGSETLDASLLLTTRFGFEHDGRLFKTLVAIERDLAVGPLVYRFTGADRQEGAFVACSCWLVEAYAFLGKVDHAEALLKTLLEKLGNNFGILLEEIDPVTGEGLGNLPQGLSHLALLHAIFSIQENR